MPVEEIQRGIKHGVRKINVDTDNRMAHHRRDPQGAGREPERVRPAQISEAGDGGDEQALHGSASRSSARPATPPKIKPLPLSAMAKRYKAGSLDPKFG